MIKFTGLQTTTMVLIKTVDEPGEYTSTYRSRKTIVQISFLYLDYQSLLAF